MEIRGYKKFLPIAASEAVDNSIFLDTSDGKFKKKIGGSVSDLGSSTPWFLDSNAYDVYDDFESYSLGTFTSNAKWTVTNYQSNPSYYSSTTTIVSNNYLPTSGKDVHLYAWATVSQQGNSYAQIASLGLTANKHKYFVFKDSGGSSDSSQIGRSQMIFGGVTYTLWDSTDSRDAGTDPVYIQIIIIAKGSGIYDIYNNGVLIGADVSASPQITIRAYKQNTSSSSAGTCIVDVPFIYESKASV